MVITAMLEAAVSAVAPVLQAVVAAGIGLLGRLNASNLS
jgi:hypothetical protein